MNSLSLPNPLFEPLVLPTERPDVILRQLTIDDAPDYFDSWQLSAQDIAEFDPESRGNLDYLEEVEAFIYQPGRLRMGTWDRNKFVGGNSLYPDTEVGVWLLGYWTDSRYTNRGYASLAAKAISHYASERFPVVRAKVMESNSHSVRILEKSGFERTGRNIGEFTLFELAK